MVTKNETKESLKIGTTKISLEKKEVGDTTNSTGRSPEPAPAVRRAGPIMLSDEQMLELRLKQAKLQE